MDGKCTFKGCDEVIILDSKGNEALFCSKHKRELMERFAAMKRRKANKKKKK